MNNDDYSVIKQKLIDEIYLEKSKKKVELDSKTHRGTVGRGYRSTIDNIWWYKYKIVSSDTDYESINLMFFKVNEEIRNQASKVVFTSTYKCLKDENGVTKKYCMSKYPYAHIDGKSGNIHPGTKKVDELSKTYDKIRQLVLCRGSENDPGPNTPNIEVSDEVYVYSKKTKVHKACYFPLIEDDEKLKENPRYKFLKEVASELPEEILSDEILKEIGKK